MSEDPRATWGYAGRGPHREADEAPSSLDTATKSGWLGAAVRPVSVVALGDGNPQLPGGCADPQGDW